MIDGSIAVGGARELVRLLVKELCDGGDASAVCEGSATGAAVLVWIGKPDEDALRTASLAHVPIVGLTAGESLPYVLDTNLVVVRPGEGLPVADVARAIASVLGDRGAGFAARLPALRESVVDEAIRRHARANAIAAVQAEPAESFPLMMLSQLRLVSAITSSYRSASEGGVTQVLLPGAGALVPIFGQLSQKLADRLPSRRLVRAALAYATTRAVGEVARWSVRSRT